MQMPGGWSMSMMWMRMPGQSWPGAAASFMAMWTPMMIAMMLPTLGVEVGHYQIELQTDPSSETQMFAIAGGYFAIWTASGLAVFALGSVIATMQMQFASIAQVIPLVAGMVVLLAGVLQFTTWKLHRLDCCYRSLRILPPGDVKRAWREGLALGLRCFYCCLPQTAILVALGMMDVRLMIFMTVAITLERSRLGRRAACVVGAVCASAGVWLILRAAL